MRRSQTALVFGNQSLSYAELNAKANQLAHYLLGLKTPEGNALLADNPLSRVPCLVTDDGLSLYDSPVICEYLDSIGDAPKLFPPAGPARWRALKQQAMGDGILDAAVPCRGELAKPKEAARDGLIARYKAAMARTVDALEADLPDANVNIGTIAVACALGYLDFRYAAEPWRPGHPKLTAWYEAFIQHSAIASTAPRE